MKTTEYTKNDLNELRLHANEIMRILYENSESGQLAILRSYADSCIKMIESENKAGK